MGIVGTVTHKDGRTPIFGATVTAESESGEIYTTESAADGTFAFPDLEDGIYTLTSVKGAFKGKETTVEVKDGRTMERQKIPAGAKVKIKVVPGDYDKIGLIINRLGYDYDELTDDDLADFSALDGADMLFLNCGSDTSGADTFAVQQNLRDFVSAGGYLYASDWEYKYVQATWPDAIDFYEEDGYSEVGPVQFISAHATDDDLALYLSSDNVVIEFDLGGWIIMNGVASTTSVLVEGHVELSDGDTLPDRPLMAYFEHGDGVVAYTSFHNEAQLTDAVRTILIYFITVSQE
jgi:hypothetical protein